MDVEFETRSEVDAERVRDSTARCNVVTRQTAAMAHARREAQDFDTRKTVDHIGADDGGNGQRLMTGERSQGSASTKHDTLTHVFRRLSDIDTGDIGDEMDEHHKSNSTEFAQAQLSDETLRHLWIKAKAGSSEFIVRDGLLYKGVEANVITSTYDYALVVPTKYQREVIHLAHDALLSRHLGVKKKKRWKWSQIV